MTTTWLRFLTLGLLVTALAFTGCGSDGSDGAPGAAGADGADGADGAAGADGADGGSSVNAGAVSDETLGGLTVMSEITGVTIASPPVVTFTLTTDTGVPITGIVPFWEDSNRYVRFTLTKLVPGTNGDPDRWVAYTRDGTTGEPDYDTGESLVDNGDGSYTFTFNTDLDMVSGVPYEPGLTHRIAGQLGSRSVPLEPQNMFLDWVPAGGAVTTTHNVAVMETCNDCHDDLVFHGRRFEVEYCVNCHNADLAAGEGDMAFMIHTIHNSGVFTQILHNDGTPYDYSEVTYPQDLANCRKCHSGDDYPALETPDGDNWKTVPNIAACDACHGTFAAGTHTGGTFTDNSLCSMCHDATKIEAYHTTPNVTPNNPSLLPGQRAITYELIDATVDDMTNVLTVNLKIYSDGAELDLTNLPTDLATPGRWPGLLLAYALPQGSLTEPMDYNNMGRRGAQPISLGLNTITGMVGSLTYNGTTKVNTFVINDTYGFPAAATLRAVGLQGYFQQVLQDSMGVDYNQALHTTSAVVAVTDDAERRTVVNSASCAKCHEFFEGHGGNRNYDIAICTLCHVPNQSSSGRSTTDTTDRGTDEAIQDALDHGTLDASVDPDDATTWPEDANNLKDLIHGIHSHSFRDRPYQFVRGGRTGYWDWSHITFPRGASTSNCMLCHESGSYALPLQADLLATTVRTTDQADGEDPTVAAAETAFTNVPNATDWINTATSSSCFYCHTSNDAAAHMMQNGGLLSMPSVPVGFLYSNRSDLGTTLESCSVCHGPGKFADLDVVHNK